jgi:hypothetical protein
MNDGTMRANFDFEIIGYQLFVYDDVYNEYRNVGTDNRYKSYALALSLSQIICGNYILLLFPGINGTTKPINGNIRIRARENGAMWEDLIFDDNKCKVVTEDNDFQAYSENYMFYEDCTLFNAGMDADEFGQRVTELGGMIVDVIMLEQSKS